MRNIFVVLGLICCLNPCLIWAADNKPLENTEFQVFKAQAELKLDTLKENQAKAIAEATKSNAEDLNKQNVIIAAQDKRIGDLNLYLAIYAIIGGVLGILVAVAAYLSAGSKAREEARKEAKESAESWFNKNEKDLLVRLDKLERDVTVKAAQAHSAINATEQDIIDKGAAAAQRISLNNGNAIPVVSAEDQSSLTAADKVLKDKPESQYTFNDWNTRAHVAYAGLNLALAADLWGKAAQTHNAEDEQIAIAYFNKGATLGQLKQAEQALSCYDEIINRFGTSTMPALQAQVAKALVNKGAALSEIKPVEKAIESYDELITRFGTSKLPALQDAVAKALVNKSNLLGKLKETEKAIESYDELIIRFGTSTLPAMQDTVAAALNGKGFCLLMQAKQAWNESTHRQSLLSEAFDLFGQAEAIPREIPLNAAVVFGNLAYAMWLLGRKVDATNPLREALRIGGEELHNAELADARMHTVVEDAGFVALVDKLWDEQLDNEAVNK